MNKSPSENPGEPRRGPLSRGAAGFTLVEVLISVTLLLIAFAIIWGSFRAVTQAWKRGGDSVADLHHGDFIMEQINAALRSAAYFRTSAQTSPYGFQFEDGNEDYPADRISWVTASRALVPPASPYARAMHRLELSIEDGPEGRPSLAVRAWPHLGKEVNRDDIEPWFSSSLIRGLDCRFWDTETEEWTDEWTTTNRLPSRVEIALYFDPPEGAREPFVLRRLVDIPVSGVATSRVSNIERRTR